jgi:hypothetical protein
MREDRRHTNNTVGNIVGQSHGKCVYNLTEDLNMWQIAVKFMSFRLKCDQKRNRQAKSGQIRREIYF